MRWPAWALGGCEAFEAAGLDPTTRGQRLEEAIDVVRLLWTEDRVTGSELRFPFEAVGFEPKPVERPAIPLLVGGSPDVHC